MYYVYGVLAVLGIFMIVLEFIFVWGEFNCIGTHGGSSIETLKTEAPETLIMPMRSDFITERAYECAVGRYRAYGRWDTDESQYKQ